MQFARRRGRSSPMSPPTILTLVALTCVHIATQPTVAAHRRRRAAEDPECSLAHLDECGKHLFLWTTHINEVKAPRDAEQLAAHCERQSAAQRCVRHRSAKCHTGAVKGFSRLLYDSIEDEFERRCDPESDYHDRFLAMAPCLDDISPALRNCTAAFILTTEGAAAANANSQSLRSKIPRACCSFADYQQCCVDAAQTRCGDKTSAFVREYLKVIAGDLFNLACGSYSAQDATCAKVRSELHTAGGNPADAVAQVQATGGVKTLIGALARLSGSLQRQQRNQ